MEQVSEVPEQKTGFELLRIIEQQDQKLGIMIRCNIFLQNNYDLLKCRYKNAGEMIRQAFLWLKTPQGFNFWEDVYQDYKNII